MGHDPVWKNVAFNRTRWELQTSPPSGLQVRSPGPELRYEELRALSEQILAERIDVTLAEVVFDFADVQAIEAPWTPVVAQLIDFARCSHAPCRITALHGQPAAIIRLLLGDGACQTWRQVDGLRCPHLS